MTATETNATRTTAFEFTDPGLIEGFFSNAYGGIMRIRNDCDRPRLRYRGIQAGTFAVETVAQTGAVLDVRGEPLQKIVVTRMVTAQVRRLCGDNDGSYTAGDIYVVSYPDRPFTARLLPGTVATCVIDPAVIARVAATAPGRRPEPIRFTGLDPKSPAAAAHWWATRCHVTELLDNPQAAAAPLLVASAVQLLAAATLSTFANTAFTDPTIEDRHDASSRTLRRAVRFIDEYAAADIAVADIAAAAGVSIRAIQLAFRRHLDTTPTAYLRRVRLDHVHRALIAADPTSTTVSAIAARWGFVNHSRFTATYRGTYGVLPSSTLRGD